MVGRVKYILRLFVEAYDGENTAFPHKNTDTGIFKASFATADLTEGEFTQKGIYGAAVGYRDEISLSRGCKV